MALKRTTHWATRELHEFIEGHKGKPFAWGEHDCCLFAANAIAAMTSVDIADDFRGKYHDQASAFEAIKAVTGGTTVADAAAHCAQKHGLAAWPNPNFAQRGDLVVIQDQGGLIAGIVHLNGRHAVSVGAKGLKLIPMTQAVQAWHV